MILNAVDSALAQDYPNLEIIVADDASPDHTADLVASRKDSRLRYHRNPCNMGRVSNYRNTLYNLANGDWVVNLDGDDYYTNSRFISEAMQAALADENIVIVAANCQIVVDGLELPLYGRPSYKVMTGVELLSNVHDRRFHFFHMSTLYRRSLALPLRFYEANVISSDWESLYRLALKGYVIFIDKVAGVWRVSDKNASMTCDWHATAENLSIWNSIFSVAVKGHNQYVQLYISKQKTLFIAAYLQLVKLVRSKISINTIIRYLLAVREYAGTVTFFLLISYYKSICWFFIMLIKPKFLENKPDKQKDLGFTNNP